MASKEVGNNEYDEYFIIAYLNNPRGGKSAAMREAGYEGAGVPQMAYRTFNRLRVRIAEEFERRKSDYAIIGHQSIVDVVTGEDCSDRDKLSGGKLLMDYGGHKPGEVIDVNLKIDSLSDGQLATRLEELERQIAAGEGRVIDVVAEPVEKVVLPDIEVEAYDFDDDEDMDAIGEWEDGE